MAIQNYGNRHCSLGYRSMLWSSGLSFAEISVLFTGIAVQRFTYGKPPINPLDDEDAEPMVPRHTDEDMPVD
jgi:hypothetical protein